MYSPTHKHSEYNMTGKSDVTSKYLASLYVSAARHISVRGIMYRFRRHVPRIVKRPPPVQFPISPDGRLSIPSTRMLVAISM